MTSAAVKMFFPFILPAEAMDHKSEGPSGVPFGG